MDKATVLPVKSQVVWVEWDPTESRKQEPKERNFIRLGLWKKEVDSGYVGSGEWVEFIIKRSRRKEDKGIFLSSNQERRKGLYANVSWETTSESRVNAYVVLSESRDIWDSRYCRP